MSERWNPSPLESASLVMGMLLLAMCFSHAVDVLAGLPAIENRIEGNVISGPVGVCFSKCRGE